MILELIIAWALNSPAAATVAWEATVAVEALHQAQADRAAKGAELQGWLNSLDGIRNRALLFEDEEVQIEARINPFGEDPFDGEPTRKPTLLYWGRKP